MIFVQPASPRTISVSKQQSKAVLSGTRTRRPVVFTNSVFAEDHWGCWGQLLHWAPQEVPSCLSTCQRDVQYFHIHIHRELIEDHHILSVFKKLNCILFLLQHRDLLCKLDFLCSLRRKKNESTKGRNSYLRIYIFSDGTPCLCAYSESRCCLHKKRHYFAYC